MGIRDIDKEHLVITGAHQIVTDEQHVEIREEENDVLIIVTQLYGPTGENLVGYSDVEFDGFPAVTVLARTPEGVEGLVHMSPFHGDPRKKGMDDLPAGTLCELFCPISKEPLETVGHVDGSDAVYYALYLTKRLSEGEMVAISNKWGDYHSRIVDNFELISYWAQQEEE